MKSNQSTMSKFHSFLLTALILFGLTAISIYSYSQEGSGRPDKLYFRSGFGFTIPVGESSDFLSPKFSTSLGGMLFLGKKNFFLYPRLGLNAYGYDQLSTDDGRQSRVENSRSTTYLLSIDLGYRTSVDRFGFYGFGGGGGGIILLPKLSDPVNGVITMSNSSNTVTLLEAGVGADYSFGNVLLFFEGSYTHGLKKLEERTYQAVPLSIGIRTNITKVFFKK